MITLAVAFSIAASPQAALRIVPGMGHDLSPPFCDPIVGGRGSVASVTAATITFDDGAGLEAIETRVLEVQRACDGFEDYSQTVLGAPSTGPRLAVMAVPRRRHAARSRACAPSRRGSRFVHAGRPRSCRQRHARPVT